MDGKLLAGMTRSRFSLVEVLVATQVLAILAGLSVPQYLRTVRAAEARSCKANLAALAAAESAYALQHHGYAAPASLTSLPGRPLSTAPKCPLHAAEYTGLPIVDGDTAATTIACPNAAEHSVAMYGKRSSAREWTRLLPAATVESIP